MTLEITFEENGDSIDIVLDNSIYLSATKEDEDLVRFSRSFSQVEDDSTHANLKAICKMFLLGNS